MPSQLYTAPCLHTHYLALNFCSLLLQEVKPLEAMEAAHLEAASTRMHQALQAASAASASAPVGTVVPPALSAGSIAALISPNSKAGWKMFD